MTTPLQLLTKLESDLDDLERVLLPLMSRPWTVTLDALAGPLERAKMNSMVAFGICDMIWVFLRIKASATRVPIDFETHPVMKELVTIQSYYRKIKEIEFPPKRTQTLDLPAARRFISHSIPQSQRINADASSSSSSPSYEVGRHSRFKGVVAAGDVEKVRVGDEEEGEGFAIVDGEDDVEMIDAEEDQGPAERAEAAEDGMQKTGAIEGDANETPSVARAPAPSSLKAAKTPRDKALQQKSSGSTGKRRAEFDVFAEDVDKYIALPEKKKKSKKQHGSRAAEEAAVGEREPASPSASIDPPSVRKPKRKSKKE